jgi:hypothetical protein
MCLLDTDIKLPTHIRNPLGGDQSALRWIGHNEKVLNIARCTPTKMFHARFVIDDHISIMPTHPVNHFPQIMVHRAITPLPFPSAHRD